MFPVRELYYEIMNELMLKKKCMFINSIKNTSVLMLNEKSHCLNTYMITTVFKINLKSYT